MKYLTPKQPGSFGKGWFRKVEHEGRTYNVSVAAGKRVRIAYTPRGTYGYQWTGRVMSADDGPRVRWSGRVGGSLGARGLLIAAGVYAEDRCHYYGRYHREKAAGCLVDERIHLCQKHLDWRLRLKEDD